MHCSLIHTRETIEEIKNEYKNIICIHEIDINHTWAVLLKSPN